MNALIEVALEVDEFDCGLNLGSLIGSHEVARPPR